MHFEYEISVDEFVASQVLYRKLLGRSRRIGLLENQIVWIIAGLFCVAIAWNQRALNWASILLTLVGLRSIYAGLVNLFPARYYRGKYRKTEFWGKRFNADINEVGFEVVAELCSWHIRWEGVKVKGENEVVFVFYSANTIFAFGKRYLNEAQQEELRKFSGLDPLTSGARSLRR